MKVLIVDDEKNIRETISKFLDLEKIDSESCSNGISAVRLLEENIYDSIILDLKMPGMDGLGLLKWLNEKGINIPVIMISAFGEINDAVNAMKNGAKDYIVKPFDPEELIIRLRRVIEEKKLTDKQEAGKRSVVKNSGFIGENKKIQQIKKIFKKVADTPSTILITGESGTGKEIAAKTIHNLSGRKDEPFIAINIGGIQSNLLESELFGHEKGAFTGAVYRKIGMFELANNGTIFLDEIGDMPLDLQVKILRVVQEKKIQRLGSNLTIPINARIISATNHDLEKLVKEKRFREDLYFRLNVIRIEIPPLRERKDDIPLLVGYLINKLNKVMNKNISGLNNNAIKMLNKYDFPGNIRELENILERAFILSDNEKIDEIDLNLKIKNEDNINNNRKKIKNIEKDAIIQALLRWDGNRTKAADELGISRRTIINKIKEYNITIKNK